MKAEGVMLQIHSTQETMHEICNAAQHSTAQHSTAQGKQCLRDQQEAVYTQIKSLNQVHVPRISPITKNTSVVFYLAFFKLTTHRI